MARISGVDLPRTKRIEIGLTYIFGIGRHRSNVILTAAGVSPDVPIADSSARAKSPAVAKRSAGDLFIAVSTAATTGNGIALRIAVSDRGVSVMSRVITAWAVGPVNGASPASIS